MTFTYSFNPEASALDAVRNLIGDVDESDPILQNEEIESFLAANNNAPLNAAIRCCEVIIARFSRRVTEKVGNVTINYSDQAKQYRQLLTDLRVRITIDDATPYAGGISKGDKKLQKHNPDRVRPAFTKDMMNDRDVSPFTSQSPFDTDIADSESTGG